MLSNVIVICIILGAIWYTYTSFTRVPTTHILIVSKDCSIKPDKPHRSSGDNTLIINQSPFKFQLSDPDTELEVKVENKSLTTDDLQYMAHEMVGGNTKYYLW
jgi:hypothetical protein